MNELVRSPMMKMKLDLTRCQSFSNFAVWFDEMGGFGWL
jgi:hypothetical protein